MYFNKYKVLDENKAKSIYMQKFVHFDEFLFTFWIYLLTKGVQYSTFEGGGCVWWCRVPALLLSTLPTIDL